MYIIFKMIIIIIVIMIILLSLLYIYVCVCTPYVYIFYNTHILLKGKLQCGLGFVWCADSPAVANSILLYQPPKTRSYLTTLQGLYVYYLY